MGSGEASGLMVGSGAAGVKAGIIVALDAAAKAYDEARAVHDEARLTYRLAVEQLAAVRRVALRLVGEMGISEWERQNPGSRYVGMAIGDAVGRALAFLDRPSSVADVIAELMSGGFEFRSPTPAREVHASALRNHGVRREGDLLVMRGVVEPLSNLAANRMRHRPIASHGLHRPIL